MPAIHTQGGYYARYTPLGGYPGGYNPPYSLLGGYPGGYNSPYMPPLGGYPGGIHPYMPLRGYPGGIHPMYTPLGGYPGGIHPMYTPRIYTLCRHPVHTRPCTHPARAPPETLTVCAMCTSGRGLNGDRPPY